MNTKYISFLLFLIPFVFKNYVRSHEDLFNEHITSIHDGELSNFITKNDIVLVMFYAPWCGHCKRLIPEYNEAAIMLSEKKSEIKLASVDATIERGLSQEYGITGYPTMILFNKKNRINYGGGRTAQTIVDWILQMTGPVSEYADHAKASLGINEFPGLAYQSSEGRYLLTNPQQSLKNHKDIISFFKDVEAGKIEKSLKSEPIPEEDKNAAVKVVVGNSFIDVVLNSGKDVLIEIYAPWCGHCKKLEPVYEELGRKLKKYDHIIVAKMDGTLNETALKEFEWSGFPTIFFVKAGSKIPLPYEGERTLKGFVDFLNKHSTKTPITIDGVSQSDEGSSEEL